MADTGAPWFIPYVEPGDLVRDYPAASEALGTAIAAGLSGAAVGVVAVESVLKTDTFSASVAAGAAVSVTDLDITYTLSDATNQLLILANFNANNGGGRGAVGLQVVDGSTPIAVGDVAGNRPSVTAGGETSTTANSSIVISPAVQFLYSPGDTVAHTYTVQAININTGTQTLFVNRTSIDSNDKRNPRGASSLTLMEIKV